MTVQKIVDLVEVTTYPKHRLGEYHWDERGRLWQYVRASGAVAQYAYVKISTDGNFTAAAATTTLLPVTEPAEVGCAQVAIADGSYGWVFRGHGAHTGLFKANCAHNVRIYTHATAGHVDDTATTLIAGLKVIATVGASDAPAAAWAAGKLVTAINRA
jgi:hypothetical protein